MILANLVSHSPQADPIAIFINLPLLALFVGLALYGFFRPTPPITESDEMESVAVNDPSSAFVESNYSV